MKKESVKLAGILCIITLVAALLLACVNKITAPQIQAAAQLASQNAMKKILSEAESFEKIDENISKGMKGTELVGYCVSVLTKGFGGNIEMMVAIGSDDKVKGIEILSHSETPGLGAKAATESFKDSFKDKNPRLNIVKIATDSPDEAQAITGATVTSKAVSDGISLAYDMVEKIKGGNK